MSTPSNPGYETIPEDEDEQPLELTAADESSHIGDINNDNDNNVMPSKKYVVSAILTLLLTFIGGRQSITTFSSKSNIDIIGGTTTANRLCEIYHDPSEDSLSNNIRIIQTSLSEPSKQWNEVPCLIHTHNSRNKNNRKLHPSDTSHSSSNPESSSSGEYYPSAIINVDFTSQPFRKRQPILGFGGAFTEAAALNFNSLSDDGKAVALELLFGKDGLGYRYVYLCIEKSFAHMMSFLQFI